MRSGPKAIHYRDCLFRVSELVWVKACPLSPVRLVLKISLVIAGALFVYAVGSGKEKWMNVECALAFFPFLVASTIRSDTRLASTGDLTDSYEGRGGDGDPKAFRSWIGALGDGDDECRFEAPGCSVWFNLNRIAWARSCWVFDLTGLIVPPIFLGYVWLVHQNFKFIADQPQLQEVAFLTYPGDGFGNAEFLCIVLSVLSIAAVVASFSRGLEVTACGGLRDEFRVNRAIQRGLLGRLAGLETASPAPVKVVAPAPVVIAPPPPVAVAAPAPSEPVPVEES